MYEPVPPFRRDFDAARDPYTARNALGITSTGSGGGGNVSNSGTPTSGQYAKWVTATTIQGVAPATVLSDIGAQPADADLTALAALTGTNVIYYRSAANTWAAVTIGANLTFSGGILAATGGGNVSNSGTPTAGQWAQWTDATHIQGIAASATGFVLKTGDTMSGNLTVNGGVLKTGGITQPTFQFAPSSGSTKQFNLYQLADTVWVSNGVGNILSIDLNSGSANFLSGPTTLTAPAGTNNTLIATTAFVQTAAKTGVTDGSNAPAGQIGQYVEGVVPSGSAAALSTGGFTSFTSVILSAGDWDISGIINFTAAGATCTALIGEWSNTPNAVDTAPGRFGQASCYGGAALANNPSVTVFGRLNLTAASTTIYLTASASFSAGSVSAWGMISARRVR